MSYLHPTRLTFSGKFQAAPSTVNNDVVHYDNATFRPNYQLPQTQTALNGWWNPDGDAAFRFTDCTIGSAYIDGQEQKLADHPLLLGSGDRVSGKIVDLDPEQQLVSEIWGLEVRITDDNGKTIVGGSFKPAPFTNIWWSRLTSPGDMGASAVYQSVLTDIKWGDLTNYPYLEKLNSTTEGDRLSIRFVIDSYEISSTEAYFTYGRVSGAIGPYLASEPAHFTQGRQFFPDLTSGGSPTGPMFFATGIVAEKEKSLLLDLGNALPVASQTGPLSDLGDISIGVPGRDGTPVNFATLKSSEYTAKGWYEATSGIVSFDQLPDQLVQAIQRRPLIIHGATNNGAAPFVLAETPGGLHVRADDFVHRLYPDALDPETRYEPRDQPANETNITLWASRFGKPLPNARVFCYFDSSQLQPGTQVAGRIAPDVGVPEGALTFDRTLVTGSDGKALLAITASDPGNPRNYIDGQIYGIRYMLADMLVTGYVNENSINPSDFISLLVWDRFDKQPTWEAIRPILQQAANLYPIMDQFIDLTSPKALAEKAKILAFVFGLDPSHPNFMPVTRDLSPTRRRTLLSWLVELQEKPAETIASAEAAEKPLSTAQVKAVASETTAADQVIASESPEIPLRGGKTAARERRLLQNRDQLERY